MSSVCPVARLRVARVCRGAIALLLLAATGMGVLPFSVELPALPTAEVACRIEPIDVCGAGDASLGMLADSPALLAEAVAVVAPRAVPPAAAGDLLAVDEGFAPGVYRPPRPSC